MLETINGERLINLAETIIANSNRYPSNGNSGEQFELRVNNRLTFVFELFLNYGQGIGVQCIIMVDGSEFETISFGRYCSRTKSIREHINFHVDCMRLREVNEKYGLWEQPIKREQPKKERKCRSCMVMRYRDPFGIIRIAR